MLKNVRKPLSIKNLFAYIIFGMICLTFVFVGLGGDQGVSTGGAAAIVNDSVISIAEFSESMRRQERQYSAFFKNLPPAQRREQSRALQSRTLEVLIRAEVAAQSAEDVGLVASAPEIADFIMDFAFLKEQGQFQPEMYENFLEANGYTVKIFEEKVRKHLLFAKLRNLFLTAMQVSQLESQRQNALKSSKVNLQFVSFDNNDIKKNYKPQAQELDDFLKNSLNRIQQYYDTHKNEFTSEEQVRARHILIKADLGDKEAQAKAFAKIKTLAERAKKEDFGKLASEFSEDPGSKDKGGDLGYFNRGQMLPAFDRVAFKEKSGQVSAPVKTPYGYHIIKVEDKKAAKQQDFESVKKQIAKKLMAEDSFPKVLDGLRKDLKSQDASGVDKFIRRYTFKWQNTGDFSVDNENIPKMGRGEEIYKALWNSTKHVDPGQILPELIESDGNYYVIKLLDIKKETRQEKEDSFDKSWRLTQRRGSEAFDAWLDHWQTSAQIRKNHKILGK